MVPLMPLTHVHLRAGRSPEEKRALLDGLHRSFVEAFGIPENDRNLLLHEYEPQHFETKDGPESVFIEATVFLGRSLDAKRKLYGLIVENLGRHGVPKDGVLIVLHEVPLENWGLRGGQAASDVSFGFKIDV
jgi:phenylpyruvate tautomerase PptA (4-oxalocrotonate tautomerase family)